MRSIHPHKCHDYGAYGRNFSVDSADRSHGGGPRDTSANNVYYGEQRGDLATWPQVQRWPGRWSLGRVYGAQAAVEEGEVPLARHGL